jgi:hypothetical protein
MLLCLVIEVNDCTVLQGDMYRTPIKFERLSVHGVLHFDKGVRFVTKIRFTCVICNLLAQFTTAFCPLVSDFMTQLFTLSVSCYHRHSPFDCHVADKAIPFYTIRKLITVITSYRKDL